MNRFLVKDDISLGGVLAYTRGQTIEADAVEAHPEWKDSVVGANTKEARAIQAEITGRPADEPAPTGRPAAPSTTAREG